ncbi:hybrid sensor histidine kinase/response regulator transcription factor [Fibrella forsythiae]|uniref:histidine kinase n=1 Tax=Fibrella forsythiae TaxID=2817061 RepID=A0ABS3JIH9_9BACT|nr:ATP-binding protein [Fibrella forsythiae]MBO0949821.1 helix-turn-helix domain-containing protein [Fibrella forsythiae]
MIHNLFGYAQSLPAPILITEQQGLPQAFVSAIVQDKKGFIWAATRDGLCRFDGQHFRVFQPRPDGPPSLSFAGITNLIPDHQGFIWIVSELGDIDLFDPESETFVNFSRQPAYQKAIGQQKDLQLFIDQRNRLWLILADQRLIRFDLDGQHRIGASQSFPETIQALDLVESRNHTIWLATRTGLASFDERTGQWTFGRQPVDRTGKPLMINRLYTRPTDGALLLFKPGQVIRFQPATGTGQSYDFSIPPIDWPKMSFATDSRGWVYINWGTGVRPGLVRFTDQKGVEVLAQISPDRPQDNGTRMWIDRSDVLWEGTGGSGIRKYDLRPNPFQTAQYRQSFHADLLGPIGLNIPASRWPTSYLDGHTSYNFRYTLDRRGLIWFSTKYATIHRYDRQSGQLTAQRLPNHVTNPVVGDPPCPLATDPAGQVWALSGSVIWFYDNEQARWILFTHRIPTAKMGGVLSFVVDRQYLWLATEQQGLWQMNRQTGQLRQFANQPGKAQSLSNNALLCLSDDPADPNRLWLGTFGNGLCAFDKQTGTFRRITQADGLPNNVIYSAIPDQQGQLWLGTNKGLCRMDRRTFATKTFTQHDGLLANEFNRFHYIHLPDDRIIMGGLEGITTFYPRQVVDDTFEPTVELVELQINNQPAPATLLDSLPVRAIDRLTLPYDLNFVTARFAALQFNRLTKNRFRYRLDGLEETWKETDNPVATYTGLRPGSYTLLLNASNTSGRWSRYVRRLPITIRPPIWSTWYAWLLYVVTLGWLAVTINRSYINRIRLQQSLVLQRRETALKQQETEQLKAVDELKSNFFANITHEFRTPLTLILGPAEQLRQHLNAPNERRLLTTIDHNAHQLLGLVNQLLDLSRLDAGALPVVNVRGDLGAVVAQTVDSFRDAATAKAISLDYSTGGLADAYWFDTDKMERVLYNLIANALHFTDAGGEVRVQLKPIETGVRLTITDTGRGISARQLPHIFDRFYQGESTGLAAEVVRTAHNGSGSKTGSGIGLSLVKELVRLQQGHIAVTSEEGKGSTFTIELPYRPAEPGAEERSTAGYVPNGQKTALTETDDDDKPLILVVEDNDELAGFILDSLPTQYRTQRAVDGQAGLEQALAELPDLIISDVLMPVMDGYALCQHLKTDVRTSHIPVMLLTAKVTLNDRIEGLTRGADEYLTKPFVVAELQLRVRNLLATTRNLRDWVRADLSRPTHPSPSPANQPPTTDPFLRTFYALLDDHLDQPAFGVDDLPPLVGMSRMSLFRKLKALTGLSPADVIRLYRLKRAAELLQSGLSVTETAERVGFQTASHFGKLFRQQYQVSPGQYARQSVN